MKSKWAESGLWQFIGAILAALSICIPLIPENDRLWSFIISMVGISIFSSLSLKQPIKRMPQQLSDSSPTTLSSESRSLQRRATHISAPSSTTILPESRSLRRPRTTHISTPSSTTILPESRSLRRRTTHISAPSPTTILPEMRSRRRPRVTLVSTPSQRTILPETRSLRSLPISNFDNYPKIKRRFIERD